MHSHSFQDEELKLHRNVDDSSGQVVVGWTILRPPRGVRNKGLITKKRKRDVHSHSFQDAELELHRNVDDTPGQVVEGLTILLFPQRGQK